MEIKASKLCETLDLLAPAVPKKTSLPVTLNVRLGEGVAVATVLEVQVTLRLPEAEGEPPMLLPHRQALEYLKAVPGDTHVILSWEGKRVLLQAGLAKLRLESAEASDFPPASQVEFAGTAEVDGDALVSTLEELAPTPPGRSHGQSSQGYASKQATRLRLAPPTATAWPTASSPLPSKSWKAGPHTSSSRGGPPGCCHTCGGRQGRSRPSRLMGSWSRCSQPAAL